MLNTMAFNLAKILRHEHACMQAWVVKDAADMLQQYTKLSSGTELMKFLMHNIEEAERMKLWRPRSLQWLSSVHSLMVLLSCMSRVS